MQFVVEFKIENQFCLTKSSATLFCRQKVFDHLSISDQLVSLLRRLSTLAASFRSTVQNAKDSNQRKAIVYEILLSCY